MSNELTPTIIDPKEFGLAENKAVEITSGLKIYIEERKVLEQQYIEAMQMEVTEENVKFFGDLRKRIKKNRTDGIFKWHKREKEFYLAGGRFVDAIKNKEAAVNSDMEDKLEAAEKHFENIEKERIEAIRVKRYEELSQYNSNAGVYPLADISEEAYQDLLNGAKLQYEARIKAEKEEEERLAIEARKNAEEQERRMTLAQYAMWSDMYKDLDIRELADEDFATLVSALEDAKAEHIAEQTRMREEAERMRREAAEREAIREARAQELQPYIVFIRDYNNLVNKPEEEYKAEFAAIKKGAELQWKAEAEEQARKDAEIAAQQKALAEAQAQLKAKQEAEARAAAEAEAKAQAKLQAEQELKSKSEQEQLLAWVNGFNIAAAPIDNDKAQFITLKFNAMKAWAIKTIQGEQQS
jgi:colicin import membrane protein